MGKADRAACARYGFSIHARIDVNDDIGKAAGADAAVEFTLPSAVVGNVTKLADIGSANGDWHDGLA